MAAATLWLWTNRRQDDSPPPFFGETPPSCVENARNREGGSLLSMTIPATELISAHTDTDMRVLVVEDDAKIASFVVNGLKQSGFAVDRCADGDEAHVLATTTAYDAAVVDIMLPKMDGLR